MSRQAWWFVLTAVCFGAGCSAGASNSSSSGSEGPLVTSEEACSALAAASCEKLNGCSPWLLQYVYGDLETCIERGKLGCPDIVTANGSGATAVALKACADALPGATCDDYFTDRGPSECLFSGSLGNGTACAAGAQCQSGACKVPAGQTCGTCGPRGGAGSTCTSSADCEAGLLCAGNGVCVSYGEGGASCDANHPCLPSLVCNSGTCASVGGPGASCDPQINNCNGYVGLFCNAASSTCQSVNLVGAGAACGAINGGYTLCSTSGVCRVGQNQQGTCLGAAADGNTCDVQQGPRCLSPAACASGQCKLSNPDACQ
ncbi:MAG: hypothetical protein AB2A00_42445 [Myxococcota bacterium]